MTTRVTAADGARLQAFVSEPPNADEFTPTVVMAHGWTLDHRSWEPVVQQLVANDCDTSDDDAKVRIVTYDQRGHGDSTLRGGKLRTGGETVRALGDDLAAIITALVPESSPIVLAGHSMGGMTVMAFAGLHPDVLRARVRAVVLVATSAGNLAGTGLPGEGFAMKIAAKLPFKPGALVRPSSQKRTSCGNNPDEADVKAVCEQIGGTRISTTGTFYSALTRHDERAALANLRDIPVTILVGSRDKLTPPRHAAHMAQELPDATLETVEGAGHMLMYEATDVVTSAIRDALASAASGGFTA